MPWEAVSAIHFLGRVPDDWDITTSANPIQVKALFRRTIDTGIQHGTVTVMIGDDGYEVTTYRMDGEYEDHRHPKEVLFTPNLNEDLKRRDFTINAMAYNPRVGIVDLYGGREDLEKKLSAASVRQMSGLMKMHSGCCEGFDLPDSFSLNWKKKHFWR